MGLIDDLLATPGDRVKRTAKGFIKAAPAKEGNGAKAQNDLRLPPPFARRVPGNPKENAPKTGIQERIRAEIKRRGMWCERIQSQGMLVGVRREDESSSVGHLATPSHVGFPDLLGCHNGRFYGIEAKNPGGVLDSLQQMRARQIEAAGGIYIVGVTLDCVTLLEQLLRGERVDKTWNFYIA